MHQRGHRTESNAEDARFLTKAVATRVNLPAPDLDAVAGVVNQFDLVASDCLPLGLTVVGGINQLSFATSINCKMLINKCKKVIIFVLLQ